MHTVVGVSGGDYATVLTERLHVRDVVSRVRVDDAFRAIVLEIEAEQSASAFVEVEVEKLVRVFAEADRLERAVRIAGLRLLQHAPVAAGLVADVPTSALEIDPKIQARLAMTVRDPRERIVSCAAIGCYLARVDVEPRDGRARMVGARRRQLHEHVVRIVRQPVEDLIFELSESILQAT